MQRLNSIESVPEPLWSSDYPFLSKAFLRALEQQGDIGAQTGWQPHYLYSEDHWLLPAFVKEHSYGEYVFDWSWAEAYYQHGLNYFPKLILAAPFTPAQGPRAIGESSPSAQELSLILRSEIDQYDLSGAHILFCDASLAKALMDDQWHIRHQIQFHWKNENYRDFDDFLDRFKSRKRKNLLKERRSLVDQGFVYSRISGQNISEALWGRFYQCYQSTYAKRGMTGYLSLSTFKQLGKTLGQQMMMAVAEKEGDVKACALFFHDSDTLYGRYWGANEYADALHFELCYYQGIEYCIEHNLTHFDPGTQGEHKISRGFEPTLRYSAHFLQRPDFHQAVQRFVKQEALYLEDYAQQCKRQLPFKES